MADFEASTTPEVPEEKHGSLPCESTLRSGCEAGISRVCLSACAERYRYINWFGMPCTEMCGEVNTSKIMPCMAVFSTVFQKRENLCSNLFCLFLGVSNTA